LQSLQQQYGCRVHQVDLDNPDNGEALAAAIYGCVGCYIHSTSSDTVRLDTKEVDRARTLCAAIVAANQSSNKNNSTVRLRHIVYNSAAAEINHGVKRIEQKHAVERIFADRAATEPQQFTFTSLRANLFMEELWKDYTRPAILKGTYPFSVPADRPIYLTSVRDMGRLAGIILQSSSSSLRKSPYECINVASDVLTPREMAEAFSAAQNSPCVHKPSRLFLLVARLFFKDLYEVIRFYRTSTETTNIQALHNRFPGQLTTFAAFLEETQWGNASLTYSDLKTVVESPAAHDKDD
jgi:hypothetical protein